MTLDHKGFEVEMEAQKTRARNAAAVEATDWNILLEGVTDTKFVGYDSATAVCRIARWRRVKQKGREFFQIILDTTPFYGEMGGQVGDRGTLTDNKTGEVIEIYDTKRENGISVHLTAKMPADPAAEFTAAIDEAARRRTAANHTATHLLHHALREVLGTHVEQKGSFVSPDVLRFDFSHFQKLTPDELRRVEHLANSYVRQAIARDEHRNVPIAKARELGAMALFGEKYGDEVRVIKYGPSIELCGGTHVDNTGEIGMIRIIGESSIAAGIRRIEALTGEAVEDLLDHVSDTLHEVQALFNNAPDLLGVLRKSIEENAELRRQAQEAMNERANTLAAKLLSSATIFNGITVVTLKSGMVPEMVKLVAMAVRRDSAERTAFVAATTAPGTGKPMLTVALTDDLVKNGMSAAVIVRNAAKAIKGGGGGQPGFAQAGGKDADGLGAALDLLHKAFE